MYLDAPDDGDGRVTVARARLPGVRTWQLDCEHGGLADAKQAFAAYLELLDTGTTRLLQPYVELRPCAAPRLLHPRACAAGLRATGRGSAAAEHARRARARKRAADRYVLRVARRCGSPSSTAT